MAIRISARLPDQSHDLPRLRVPPESPLGKDEVAIHRHFEDTAGGGNETDFRVRPSLFQLSRQTGGSGLVVSDDAELDDRAHHVSSSRVAGRRIVAETGVQCHPPAAEPGGRAVRRRPTVTPLLVRPPREAYLFVLCEPTHSVPSARPGRARWSADFCCWP